MTSEVLIEWIKHRTVRPDLVGKRTKMGQTQATNQIAKGRAMLVEVEESKPRGRTRKPKGDEEAAEAGD